jgi:hypothetical protein
VSKSDIDNRSNQLNPNNESYYQSRGSGDLDDDYDDDVGYPGPYIISAREGPAISTFEQKQKRFLDEKKMEVATTMTTWKAADALSAMLSYNFPSSAISIDYVGRSVRITVTGCTPSSELAQSIQKTANSWVVDRNWLVGRCVEDLKFVFKR